MTQLEILIKSVEMKKPISFQYNKPDKIKGIRIGNVHAVFIFTSKAGAQSTKLHIVQTSGVSDTVDEKPFPDFRMFNIIELDEVLLLEDEPCFEIHTEKYNPEWEGYKEALAKV